MKCNLIYTLKECKTVSHEGKIVVRWVRASLVQMGVETQGLDIMYSNGGIQIRGEIRRQKPSFSETDKSRKRLLETIGERLRQHKLIKRVRIID
jgi:hypothetical protein